MSFIGPRPDTPMYLDKYTEEERIVLTVRPGITGYNQAVNRNSVLACCFIRLFGIKDICKWK